MEHLQNKIYTEIATTAAEYIKNSARQHLPDSAQKDFMLWILADHNHYQNDYLKMLGVASSIELEIAMLDNITNEAVTFHKLTPYLGFLNAYFAFETLQDNLAIGLANWFYSDDLTYQSQRAIVKNFNPLMINKLCGGVGSVAELLAPYNILTKNISAYQRCLSPAKMYEFANQYGKHCHDNTAFSELEHCFYPILILNIETCLALLKSLETHSIYSLLKKSLIARYNAVDQVLRHGKTATSLALADLGAKAILVLPTLVYCIGALDIISPNKALEKTIRNNSLMRGIYSSALLVRLLNDMGTPLLTVNAARRKQWCATLQRFSKKKKYHSVLMLLQDVAHLPEYSELMVRIRKDIQYGEFNICLDNIRDIHNVPKALHEFCNHVQYFSDLYQQYYAILMKTCHALNEDLNDNTVSKLLFNMFKFHEKMYSIEFEKRSGDYAVLETGGSHEKSRNA